MNRVNVALLCHVGSTVENIDITTIIFSAHKAAEPRTVSETGRWFLCCPLWWLWCFLHQFNGLLAPWSFCRDSNWERDVCLLFKSVILCSLVVGCLLEPRLMFLVTTRVSCVFCVSDVTWSTELQGTMTWDWHCSLWVTMLRMTSPCVCVCVCVSSLSSLSDARWVDMIWLTRPARVIARPCSVLCSSLIHAIGMCGNANNAACLPAVLIE